MAINILENELEFKAIRSQGSGGQNVNKVSTAIQLFFDIRKSSLSDFHKNRLLRSSDQRITKDGIIIFKVQEFRSQEKNRLKAIQKLEELIQSVSIITKARKPTKPSWSSKNKRMDKKTQHSQKKNNRGRVDY